MIIAFIFILAGITFLIGTAIYVKKNNNLQEIKPLDKANIKKSKKTLRSLWGIDGISNSIISTNKGQHSIIVELGSIEYSLLHDEEKYNVDNELSSIGRMLNFPIQFLEIKQKVNLEESIENIKINTMNSNKNIKEYASNIIKHLENIGGNQNLFERKNYMIISTFNKRKIAENELKEFYDKIKYRLQEIKISSRILDDMEIMELIYEQLHKGSKSKVRDVIKKGGLDLYVTSKK